MHGIGHFHLMSVVEPLGFGVGFRSIFDLRVNLLSGVKRPDLVADVIAAMDEAFPVDIARGVNVIWAFHGISKSTTSRET